MNSNRRADLQRKLSMGAVPRPPAGLAERIKNDIPDYLQAEPERQRFSRSVAFSMRVAASILLLITSVFVTLNLIEPDQRPTVQSAGRVPLAPAVMRTSAESKKTAVSANGATVSNGTQASDTAAVDEIRLEMTELAPESEATPPSAPPARQFAEEARGRIGGTRRVSEEASAPAPVQEAIAVTAEAPTVGEAARDYAPEPSYAPSPVPPPPPSAEAAVPEMAPKPASAPQARNERASSGFFMKNAIADGLDLEPRKNIFGVAVDASVFRRIKTSLENGERPAENTVDVEALVNYFAGAPAKPPRRGVRLEVEASPAPVNAEGDHAVLRFTIDTPAAATEAGESTPPAARDASIKVNFNSEAVDSFKRVGDGDPIVSESVLLSNVSVTVLYELELRPRLKSTQRVATVSLHYVSLEDGKPRDIQRVILGRDLAGNWGSASRRHRLASLGAVWGQSLMKSSSPQPAVVRRAEELVTQNPKDPLARELAHAANATGGER
jgi:hypothetical protein